MLNLTYAKVAQCSFLDKKKKSVVGLQTSIVL